jgi:CheY-like chemotaxis protein
VDDSVESRKALRELLEAQGITIMGEAADGARGIEFAQKLMPDVVLMDVKMPGIGGVEARDHHQQPSRARHRAHHVR